MGTEEIGGTATAGMSKTRWSSACDFWSTSTLPPGAVATYTFPLAAFLVTTITTSHAFVSCEKSCARSYSSRVAAKSAGGVGAVAVASWP